MELNEGNISNTERVQKQVHGVIASYNNKVNPEECTYTKTSKGNWQVADSAGKKVCIVSKFVLPDNIATELGYYKEPEPPAGE